MNNFVMGVKKEIYGLLLLVPDTKTDAKMSLSNDMTWQIS